MYPGLKSSLGLPWWLSGEESACHCRKHRIDPWSRKIPTCGSATKPMTTTTEHAEASGVLPGGRMM